MKCEWKEYNLGSLITFKNGKKRPDTGINFPVYGGNGVLGYTDKWNNENCVIIGRVGAYCGSVFREKGKCWISDNAISGISDNNNIEYLYYLLKLLQLNKRHIGTSQPLLTQEILNNIKVIIPPYTIQNKISAILCSIDDKIELNNKINENLERQVQAIYQEWFGNVNTANEQGLLSDICSYSKDRVAVSKLDINNYFSTENMLPGKAGATEASSLPTTAQTTACHVGDTLISNIRPYFKKIVYCHEDCGCSTDVLCFVPMYPKYSAYIYSTLYADKFFDFMVAGSKGTKMPRGDKQQIMTYPIILPSNQELESFNSLVLPILAQIQNNRIENKRLALLRDTLLPKLMSGEIEF